MNLDKEFELALNKYIDFEEDLSSDDISTMANIFRRGVDVGLEAGREVLKDGIKEIEKIIP